MKIGFLFPGQGAQYIGMGKDLYENYEEARKVYDLVHEITGIDVKHISFEGDEDTLNKTQNTQICILTMSLAILSILNKKHIYAEIAAGLSLGEYSALICSNALSIKDGIKIVQKRGEFMQNLVPDGEWCMAAILGLDEKTVQEISNEVTDGFIAAANYNCVGQIAVSGERKAIEQASQIAKEKGAKRVIMLKTAGPFHTVKLKAASDRLREELKNFSINSFNIPVVKNLDGNLYKDTDDVKDILVKHIINPVQFTKTIITMIDMGVDTFIEIGPGKVLSGFVKRCGKDVKILNINNVDTLESTIKYIREGESQNE